MIWSHVCAFFVGLLLFILAVAIGVAILYIGALVVYAIGKLLEAIHIQIDFSDIIPILFVLISVVVIVLYAHSIGQELCVSKGWCGL